MNWKSVGSDIPGTTHYKRSHPKAEAWIRRQNGHLEGEAKSGPFNLGRSAGVSCMDHTLPDEVVLAKLDDGLNPPRFQNWKTVDDQLAAGVTHYRGQAGHRKVEAFITRVGEEAEVRAQVGHFGTQIEGSFFAPAPSDREILQRISRSI
ncbi:hypothetical protein JST97_02190 [bacterium]|nr:hypothetical protein [bacterium]